MQEKRVRHRDKEKEKKDRDLPASNVSWTGLMCELVHLLIYITNDFNKW